MGTLHFKTLALIINNGVGLVGVEDVNNPMR
jgi:hypothetical protein